MPKKVAIDCDPGIDDALAICMALFDPRLEVVAVTATAGNVDAHQATRNVHAILEQLDPPKWPRIGAAEVSDRVPSADGRQIHGDDGLGDTGLAGTELHNVRPAERVIAEAVRDSPGDVTIVALGPLTNIARAFQMDRELAPLVDRVIMIGGSVQGIGNITASAEFNMYCDPQSAREVFLSPTTKTLVPLEVTQRVTMSLDFVNQLPSAATRAGMLMRKLLPSLFRGYRQHLGQEGVHLHDALGILAAVQPELFETQEMAGDVEVNGELTRGLTVFDRRPRKSIRNNMEVAVGLDEVAAKDCIIRSLKFAGQNTA